ncbi:MAG: hypothetical protein EXR09_05575 [Acetobacteraceae bacterium]|nr:hypothetical protein [Acetobacteraceae bacterium]
MTQAELVSLLRDCLVLWGVEARLVVESDGLALIVAGEARYHVASVEAALRPARWQLQTPARALAGRPARMHPSIGALLSSLRNELGANTGSRLRVGPA